MFKFNLDNKTIDARGAIEERYEGQTGFSPEDFLEAFEAMGGDDVTVLLQSPGGVITEGLSIFGMFEAYGGKITVEIDSLAASIASVIAMAADEVVMRRKAKLFVHDPWTVAMGAASDFRNVADMLDVLAQDIAEVYAERTGGDVETWLQYMRNETWFNAEEAVEAGIADRIASKAKAAPSNDRGQHLEPVAFLPAVAMGSALDKRARCMGELYRPR